MRFSTALTGVVVLAAGLLQGCTGVVGSGSSDTGGPPAVGPGGSLSGASGASGGSNAAGTAGTSGTSDASNASVPGALNLDGAPQHYRVIRISNAQWAQSVQDILGLAAPSGLEQSFQSAVTGTTDFSNNELVLDVTQESWGDFQSASETLAAQVTATDAGVQKIYAGTDAAGFITSFGRRAYRRPLTSAEQATYLALFNQGASLTGTRSTFAKGASLVIRAMLQSPNFLYRTELVPGQAPLSAYEVAAKLSLWLRGTTPSDALLDSGAGPGKLDTADGAEALAKGMLEEPGVKAVMRQFHAELLHFDRYDQISKVGVPNYTAALNTEFRDVSNLFFDKIFSQNLGVKEILTSTSGFVGPGTAPLYGITAPATGYVEADLGPQRVGYFSQVPFLALYGFNADPDSIHRGVSMNLDVLCAKLGPPAAVLPPIPPTIPGQTNRQRIDTLTSACGAKCHNDMINPMGFAFEHFDGMGQYRATENGGLPIDSSGTYAFASGTKSYTDAGSLMQVMAADSQAHLCYAKKLASYGLQRDIVATDMPLLQTLADASMASTGSVKNMILQLVRSDAFRTRAGGNQ